MRPLRARARAHLRAVDGPRPPPRHMRVHAPRGLDTLAREVLARNLRHLVIAELAKRHDRQLLPPVGRHQSPLRPEHLALAAYAREHPLERARLRAVRTKRARRAMRARGRPASHARKALSQAVSAVEAEAPSERASANVCAIYTLHVNERFRFVTARASQLSSRVAWSSSRSEVKTKSAWLACARNEEAHARAAVTESTHTRGAGDACSCFRARRTGPALNRNQPSAEGLIAACRPRADSPCQMSARARAGAASA
eukprot:6214498-Pleurochrysis_carterae.AAC.3